MDVQSFYGSDCISLTSEVLIDPTLCIPVLDVYTNQCMKFDFAVPKTLFECLRLQV